METSGRHDDVNRLKQILQILEQEWLSAMKSAGVDAFVRLYDNGKKHILDDGEYCISLDHRAALCRAAGFKTVAVRKSSLHKGFGAVVAQNIE